MTTMMPAHFQIKHQDYLQGQAWHVLQNKNNIKYYVHSAHDVYLQTAKKKHLPSLSLATCLPVPIPNKLTAEQYYITTVGSRTGSR